MPENKEIDYKKICCCLLESIYEHLISKFGYEETKLLDGLVQSIHDGAWIDINSNDYGY